MLGWFYGILKNSEYQADTGSRMEPKKQETSTYADTGSGMEPIKQETPSYANTGTGLNLRDRHFWPNLAHFLPNLVPFLTNYFSR